MKSIFISAGLALALLLASCSDWTKTESLVFDHPIPSEKDPAQNQKYLEALKAYKNSDHKVALVTIAGTSGTPTRQNQHLTSVPDSVDIICMYGVSGLHPTIAAEIPQMHQKGTQVVCVVDYSIIESTWKAMQGEDAEPDPTGFAAYCTEQTDAQLSYCDKYGFDGIEISYLGRYLTEEEKAGQGAFFTSVESWRTAHQSKIMFIRGYVQNIQDRTRRQAILEDCLYTVLPCGTSVSDSQLDLIVRSRLAEGVPTDRVVIEVGIPSVTDPVQTGATPQRAAEWVTKESTSFTKRGLAASNAQDDYFTSPIYKNIRQAIGIMDPQPEEE